MDKKAPGGGAGTGQPPGGGGGEPSAQTDKKVAGGGTGAGQQGVPQGQEARPPGGGGGEPGGGEPGGGPKGYRRRVPGGGGRGRAKAHFPVDKGLPDYAESREKMPWIEERLRKRVRDDTARRVLEQLGEEREVAAARYDGESSERFFPYAAYDLTVKICDNKEQVLRRAVHKQMERVTLFIDEDPHQSAEQDIPRREESQSRMDAMKSQYLLGKFDNLTVPVRADYDDAWKPQQPGDASSELGLSALPDCDQGFRGWFWVVHAAAPNIGESQQADDFIEYSREEGPRRRRLNEEMYLDDMGRIWRNCLLSMGYMGVEDAILFPFGMGAFLRHLEKNDGVYSDIEALRNLRYGIAAELFKAVDELCLGARRRGPARVHLCLVVPNAESIENHNAFVEALSQKATTCPDVARVVALYRNTDALQMAHSLATRSNGDLKVAVLNGANRKLVGNHWFQNGALNAIDENLHRRSAPMARAALLVNMDTEARERQPAQLKETVVWLGGKALRTSDGLPLGGAVSAKVAASEAAPAAKDDLKSGDPGKYGLQAAPAAKDALKSGDPANDALKAAPAAKDNAKGGEAGHDVPAAATASQAPAGVCPSAAPPPPKTGCCDKRKAPKAKAKAAPAPTAGATNPQADAEQGGGKAKAAPEPTAGATNPPADAEQGGGNTGTARKPVTGAKKAGTGCCVQ